MKRSHIVDLNLDAGEFRTALDDGSEEALYQLVTSVNVACGGHAGDDYTMKKSVELALKYELYIGAHPSFPDRKNFGREVMTLSRAQLIDSIINQIDSLQLIIREFGTSLSHVKPHGALYNLAAVDSNIAEAIISAVSSELGKQVPIMGLAGSPFISAIIKSGTKALSEAFADRRYEDDGTLRSRKYGDALITDPEVAARQAHQIVYEKSVNAISGKVIPIKADSICIHGDTDNSLQVANAIKVILKG